MRAIRIAEAPAHLVEIIAEMIPGESLVLTQDGEPVATLSRNPKTQRPCKAGSAKDTSFWMAPDFDAPLDNFREYME